MKYIHPILKIYMIRAHETDIKIIIDNNNTNFFNSMYIHIIFFQLLV